MKRLVVEPDGWECSIEECPPGHFVFDDRLCFKSEYGTNDGGIEVFCETGEAFVKRTVIVQPVMAHWESD